MPVTGQRVVRRALGRRLTRLRIASGKSRREVAEARLGISEPTLHRIETGKVPVTVANVRALCWLYGVDASITDALAELALGTSQEEWWDSSPVIPDWFKLYVGLEASASRICSYDGEVVPGELQTERYARAVFAAEQPPDPEAADPDVRWPRPGWAYPNPRCTASRPARHRSMPWAAGTRAAMAGAFRILDFDDPEDPDVVYLESHVGALYLQEAAEVEEYRRIFDLISKDAIPVEEYR